MQMQEEPFPEITVEWLSAYGSPDPEADERTWREFNRRAHSDGARLRALLRLATGLGESAVRHYLTGRWRHLGAPSLLRLDSLMAALNRPRPRLQELEGDLARASLTARRIALVTRLRDVPGLGYHVGVILGITAGAAHRGLATVLHEVSDAGLASDLDRAFRHHRPSACVLVRISPGPDAIAVLSRWSLPTVLVHADRLRYPSPPILANVTPDQGPIEAGLRLWALALLSSHRSARDGGTSGPPDIVVVAMPDEKAAGAFPSIDGLEPSIRNERKALIRSALEDAGARVLFVEVEDYSFRHALRVLEQHPNAAAYVCLSDEIAVGVKHLLTAKGIDPSNMVVGFDDSDLARSEGITSFSQHLNELGERASDVLNEWLRAAATGAPRWPEFRQISTDVNLVVRG
jgi:DNA-binding LacI/PurR family transcriptional regulator